MPQLDLDAELAAIPDMSFADLRKRWSQLTGEPAPRVRHTLLRMALSFELQASIYGGLSRRTAQRLGSVSSTAPPASGTRLVREWKGTLHSVVIDADNRIHWKGQRWNSLSEVAREITGTRWSGPAFFGLKKGEAA